MTTSLTMMTRDDPLSTLSRQGSSIFELEQPRQGIQQ